MHEVKISAAEQSAYKHIRWVQTSVVKKGMPKTIALRLLEKIQAENPYPGVLALAKKTMAKLMLQEQLVARSLGNRITIQQVEEAESLLDEALEIWKRPVLSCLKWMAVVKLLGYEQAGASTTLGHYCLGQARNIVNQLWGFPRYRPNALGLLNWLSGIENNTPSIVQPALTALIAD